MALPKTSTHNGFTLIEVLIVVALLSAALSFVLFAGLGEYRGDASRAEKNTIIVLLQKARADALNKIGQAPHGLALFPSDSPVSYVLFEGQSYEASVPGSRVAYPASYALVLEAGSLREVVFEAPSGTTCCSGSIGLTDPARGLSSSIGINTEGQID